MASYRRRYRRYRKPMGRRPRRTYRKRRAVRRRTNRVRTQRIRNVNYMGDRVLVTFKDEVQVNLKQTAVNFYASNSPPGNYLLSPNIPTLTQYVNQYQYCRVIKSTCKATFTNVEALASKDVGITQWAAGQTVGVGQSALNLLSEQPRTKSVYLSPLSGSKSTATLSMTGSLKTAYGNSTNTTSTADRLPTSALGTSPPTPAFFTWLVWAQNVSGAGTLEANGTNIRIMMTYYVEFTDRKTQVL